MLIVKNIVYEEVPDKDYYEFGWVLKRKEIIKEGDFNGHSDDIYGTTEMIIPRRFRTPNKKHFLIGWSKRVQKILKFPFEAFDNQEKQIEDHYREKSELKKEIAKREHNISELKKENRKLETQLNRHDKIRKSFKSRLKFLFDGEV